MRSSPGVYILILSYATVAGVPAISTDAETRIKQVQKPQSYEVQFLRYEVRQNFLSFWVIFCPFNLLSPNNSEDQNFEKLKKTSADVIILNLCNKKTRSYDVCLLRYGMLAQTYFFVILGHILLFCPTIDPKH